ncbi:MAG: DUF177 domain-containing protein [Kiloniellaceae bacterium]
MATWPQQPVEFSRLVPLERIGQRDIVEEIAASAEERAGLAKRFGLLALDRLTASLRLRRCGGRGLVRVSGRFAAEVTQACVVSLEPVKSYLEESFSQLYTFAPLETADHADFIDLEAEDPPEPAGPGGIELGEAVAQQLALALDPYPRAPGAKLAGGSSGGAQEGPERHSPFAVLRGLKRGE